MATIVVDGKDQLQEDGVSLGDIRATYPNCYLIKETGNVAIRRSETILEKGFRYALIEAKPGKKFKFFIL
jgi:hypothetical protein